MRALGHVTQTRHRKRRRRTTFASKHNGVAIMVRSTTIARASDALPLAASVDDEQVNHPRALLSYSLTSSLDGANTAGAQTTV